MDNITKRMLDDMECFYDEGTKGYIVLANDSYIRVNETSVKNRLASAGLDTKRQDGENVNQVAGALQSIQDDCHVHFTGEIAGYPTGLVQHQGKRLLITGAANLIEPADTDATCPHLLSLIHGTLGETQALYFMHWLKRSYETLRGELRAPGHAMVLCGPANSNKSLLQRIFTVVLGGRSASPYQYMTGATAFNADLYRAEHWCLDDEHGSTNFKDRRRLGDLLKQVTVGQNHRIHAKGRDGMAVDPFVRISISCNDTLDAMAVLPPITEDLIDKLIILKTRQFALPMPEPTQERSAAFWGKESPERRAAFWEALVAEVPAFLRRVLAMELPEEMEAERFGLKAYQHPEVVAALGELTPETHLLDFLDGTSFRESITGRAGQVYAQCRDHCEGNCTVSVFDKLVKSPNAMGHMLARLKSDRVTRRLLDGNTIWSIEPKFALVESTSKSTSIVHSGPAPRGRVGP